MKDLLIIFCLLIAGQACTNTPELESEKKAILTLHNQQQKAHLEKNARLLLGDSSADYVEVNRGKIKKPTYAENLKRFTTYFEMVDFVKWEDVTPPTISFSDDATMATSVVDKLVITRNKLNSQLDTTRYAWLAVYKKANGKWYLHRMGSTNQ